MKKTKQQSQDLLIIGGGIMGLMTAYYASSFVKEITILEKLTIGNKESASFSFTRSLRTDYLDQLYTRYAYEAQLLWLELQKKSFQQFFINCGCLNIAKKSITPALDNTYGAMSFQNLDVLNFQPRKYNKKDLQKRYPQFTADFGFLDTKGGFLYLPTITNLLLQLLQERHVTIKERTEILSLEQKEQSVIVTTKNEQFVGKQVVITAGQWVNDVVKRIKKNKLVFPINASKPTERKYYYPSQENRGMFYPEKLPVFAYLDVGIYGHPIFDKKKNAVKISYYNSPDLTMKSNKRINSIADFINECLPVLKNARSEDITDSDLCSYDFVSDDNFIISKLPFFSRITVGAGWRGTGYKFAPLVGKILSQLALHNGTVYDISKFSAARFIN